MADQASRLDHQRRLRAGALLRSARRQLTDLRDRARSVRQPPPAEFPRRALLPSLGFFGGLAVDRWQLPVDATIRALRIRLPSSDTDHPLSLRGVELIGNGRVLSLPPDGHRAHFSSYPRPNTAPERWLRMQVSATNPEPTPWWLLEFVQPVRVDSVLIYNRREAHGARNRRLKVDYKDQDGRWHKAGYASSGAEFDRDVQALQRWSGRPISTRPVSTQTVRQSRVRIVASLARSLETADPPPDLSRDDIRRLFAVLPSVRTVRHPKFTGAEWTVLVNLLLHQLRATPGTATSVASFAELLPTRASLRELAGGLTARAPRYGLPELLLTRHGVRPTGSLRQRSRDYLDLIERVGEAMDALGRPVMLAYGTLLGAVRERDFLIHDDDIDLMFTLPDGSTSEVARQLRTLHQGLREAGWNVSNDSTMPMNFHVTDRVSKLHLDLFPVLVDGGSARLHMEQMQIRQVDATLVVPPVTLDFLGHRFAVPARPEAFLAERYGEQWQISDPYYDWPWPLQEDT